MAGLAYSNLTFGIAHARDLNGRHVSVWSTEWKISWKKVLLGSMTYQRVMKGLGEFALVIRLAGEVSCL